MATIRGLLVITVTFLYLTGAALLGIPHVLLTGRLWWIYAEARFGVRWLLRLAGVRVIVHGAEQMPKAPAVFMANHTSNLDPPVLFTLIPGELSILAKKELFRVPVLGLVLRTGRFIPVDRSDKDAARQAVDRAAEDLRNGRPFLVFPEGTRSRDGQLLPFKKGPFILAEKAGAPIVPMTVVGTRALMSKGGVRISPGTVHVYVHPAVIPGGEAERERTMEEVRRRIASEL